MEALVFAVTGGRDEKRRAAVWKKLDKYHRRYRFTHLICGGARGLDTLAYDWCLITKGVQPVVCPAMWDRDGKYAAGPIRNRAMALLMPQRLLRFPGGKGTADMEKVCRKLSIPVTTIKLRAA